MQLQNFVWLFHEAKILTSLALPTGILYFTEGMQAKLSNIFIGRSSGKEISMMLSALFIAQIVTNLTAYPISLGISAYVNILCSQAYGAKQYRLVGLYFYRALFMSALTIFPLCTLFICIRPFIYAITQDWELAFQTGTFMSIFCLGYPAYVYHKVAIAFLQSQNVVWPSLFYLILGNISNGVLQYFLIMQYDKGITGAAAGYVISMYLLCLLLYAHIRFSSVHTLTHVDWTIEMIGEWYHTFQYAISTTIQMFASIYTSGLIPLIVLGILAHDEWQIAIYSILYSLWFVFYLFAMGYGSAITVRLGNILGASQPIQAKRAAIFGFTFGGIIILLESVCVIILSEPLSYLFTIDPKLASELSFSIKILSITIFGDIVILEQSILNACCFQKIDALLKFIFRIVLGAIIAFVWAHYVEWKALSLLMSLSLMCFVCTIIGLITVSCYNWEKLSLKVSKNTKTNLDQSDNDDSQISEVSGSTRNIFINRMCHSTLFILLRYLICMSLGAIIFIFAFTYYY